LGKFRDNDVSGRENVERFEEVIPKGAVSYTVQERETVRGKVRVGRERDWFHGTLASKGIVIIEIIIIIIIIKSFGFTEVRTTRPSYFLTHTEQSF